MRRVIAVVAEVVAAVVSLGGCTDDLPDGDLKVALNLLCDLHALSTIEADRAWFMEHGRLTTSRSKAISREVNALCRKVRPLAVDLVDAFGVPPEMLRSPELLTWGA